MPSAGFELAIPTFKRLHTYTLDRTATGFSSLPDAFLSFPYTLHSVRVKVKVKFTVEQATKGQMGGGRCIDLHSANLGAI